MNPFTVCVFAVTSAVIISVIKHLKPELANIAAAIAGVLIFLYVAESIVPFIEFIRSATKETGVESYFSLMLKALAISMCCRMSAEICRDCGEAHLASRVELAGKTGIVLISLPIVQQLLSLAKDLLG